MTDLCIQVHLNREPLLDLNSVRAQCERLTNETGLICRFSQRESDDGACVNLMFKTDHAKMLWQLLYEQLYQTSASGGLLRTSSIAVCEGRFGWDDYLLLYHFDPGEKCDKFPED
jgi:hypothetical protein